MKTCYEQLKPEIKELISKKAKSLPMSMRYLISSLKSKKIVSDLPYSVYLHLTMIKTEKTLFDYFENQI